MAPLAAILTERGLIERTTPADDLRV